MTLVVSYTKSQKIKGDTSCVKVVCQMGFDKVVCQMGFDKVVWKKWEFYLT